LKNGVASDLTKQLNPDCLQQIFPPFEIMCTSAFLCHEFSNLPEALTIIPEVFVT